MGPDIGHGVTDITAAVYRPRDADMWWRIAWPWTPLRLWPHHDLVSLDFQYRAEAC
jgi:hypothetical protein